MEGSERANVLVGGIAAGRLPIELVKIEVPMNRLFQQQSDHPLFRYFTGDERMFIEAISRVTKVAPGEYLIRQGETDSTLYGIEDGHLDIETDRNGQPAVIATVGPGDVLGEISFIDDSPRVVSVKAGEEAKVRAWEKSTLLSALNQEPLLLSKFAVALSELLVERLRENARRRV